MDHPISVFYERRQEGAARLCNFSATAICFVLCSRAVFVVRQREGVTVPREKKGTRDTKESSSGHGGPNPAAVKRTTYCSLSDIQYVDENRYEFV